MAISATLKAKQLNGVVPFGDGWGRHVEIDVEDLDIAEAVNADEIINEYSTDDLLDAIGEDAVISWLKECGYEVNSL
ncbi:Uncharacterised protein [Cedecea lapagei]|uniref:Uncharacterized protein n=1 Tax=Cedecea lapagei TaxID=158823 RepID=A0A447V290_9ENTR|nr:hypothetical protein [Cedecea lapagei]VEB97370.1 Uncharacterised protein [Cedecea lapagei]